MNIAACIQRLFPEARQGIDFIVIDRLDGKGPRVDNWQLEAPQPTEQELSAIAAQVELDLDAARMRAERDALLRATDWTQLPDVPQASRDYWAPYREALRNLPQQPGWPIVDFPSSPRQ